MLSSSKGKQLTPGIPRTSTTKIPLIQQRFTAHLILSGTVLDTRDRKVKWCLTSKSYILVQKAGKEIITKWHRKAMVELYPGCYVSEQKRIKIRIGGGKVREEAGTSLH